MLHCIIVAIIFFVLGLAWGAGIMVIRRGGFKTRPYMSPNTTRAVQIGGDHYRSKTIQPWDAMEVWMNKEQFKGFLRGNAIKYLARCDDKGGMEDIKKAGHYIAKILEGK